MTDLRGTRHGCDALRDHPVDVVQAVTGLVVHELLAEPLYGWSPEPHRLQTLHLRPAAALVHALLDLDPRPLTEPRPVDRRIVGNCRHFSVLAVALLRSLGIAARSRCGFSSYVEPGLWDDHWILEWWDGGRWRRADPQIDPVQREFLGIDFDTMDLPPGRFLAGGEAWRRCRGGQADPELFGIQELRGWFEIRGNVVRDLAALNKVELLPWDDWGLLCEEWQPDDPGAFALLDEVADAGTRSEGVEARDLFAADPRLRPDGHVRSGARGGEIEVVPELSAGGPGRQENVRR